MEPVTHLCMLPWNTNTIKFTSFHTVTRSVEMNIYSSNFSIKNKKVTLYFIFSIITITRKKTELKKKRRKKESPFRASILYSICVALQNSNRKITMHVDKTESIIHDASAFYRFKCLTELLLGESSPCCAYLTAEHIHGTVDVIINME